MNVIESFSLAGTTAVVTGGAGLFGRQIVQALAEAGATTFTASRNLQSLSRYAEAMKAQGLDVRAVEFDQASEESCRELLENVISQTGGCGVLVNNSVLRPMKDWSDDLAAWQESMRVNATGLFCLTRLFGDHMVQRGGGSIINIGSIQGVVGPDYSLYEGLGWGSPPDYFFHKGGMMQLTRYVASRLGPKGVRCNCIVPGGFFNDQDPIFVKRYNDRTFLGRMANDTDIKGAIVFLASPASAYITGAALAVDGGYTAK